LTQGLAIFQDFLPLAEGETTHQTLPQLPSQPLYWRGSKRSIEISLPGQEISESQWRLLITRLQKPNQAGTSAPEKSVLIETFKLHLELHPDEFTLTWAPG